MRTIRKRDLHISLEAIDHQFDSNFGRELEAEFIELKKFPKITNSILHSTKLSSLIKKHTGLDITIEIETGLNAYVYPPDINRNNVLINNLQRHLMSNEAATKPMHEKHFIEGTVNLKEGIVSGDFSTFNCIIRLGNELLMKNSAFTVSEVVGILMHELGHVFVFFEMITRVTKTNYVLEEGTKRLMKAQTKEQRLVILDDIEKCTGTKIPSKEMLASKARVESAYRVIILNAEIESSKLQYDCDIYNSRSYEQLADLFATRYGYSKHLATGLTKLYKKGGDSAFWSSSMNTFINVLKPTSVIVSSIANPVVGVFTVLVLLLMGSPNELIYDNPKNRLLKLKQQINDALKDHTLPVEIRQVYLNDHREISGLMDEMLNNIDWWTFIYSYLLPPGRKERKTIEQIEQLESLHNNDLFTAATALELT